MMLWQTIEFFLPYSGFLFLGAVTAWYATKYILFNNTCYHEAEFKKEQELIKAVRRHEERKAA